MPPALFRYAMPVVADEVAFAFLLFAFDFVVSLAENFYSYYCLRIHNDFVLRSDIVGHIGRHQA